MPRMTQPFIRLTLLMIILRSSSGLLGKPKILIVESLDVAVIRNHTNLIEQNVKENIAHATIETLHCNGKEDDIRMQMQGYLSKSKPDLVFSVATIATKVAKEMLEPLKIPLIFVAVMDPVAEGFVKGLNQKSSGLVTGRTYTIERGTKLRIADRLLGKKKAQFGLIYSSYPSSLSDAQTLKKVGKEFSHLSFLDFQIPYQGGAPEEIRAMMNQAMTIGEKNRQQIDYIWAINGPLTSAENFSQTMSTIRPVIYGSNIKSVKDGSLFTILPNPKGTIKEVTSIAIDILNGSVPGFFPVKPPQDIIFALNISTANKLKLVIPSDLLKLAGEHIYQ